MPSPACSGSACPSVQYLEDSPLPVCRQLCLSRGSKRLGVDPRWQRWVVSKAQFPQPEVAQTPQEVGQRVVPSWASEGLSPVRGKP